MYKIITLEIFSTVKPSLPVTYGIPLVDIPKFFSSLWTLGGAETRQT